MTDVVNRAFPRLDLTERSLVQAGPEVHEAVGLRPEQHFEGAWQLAGRGVRLNIRPGFDLSAFTIDVADQPVVNVTTQPCLAIVVLLSGVGEGYIVRDGEDVSATPYRAGNLYCSLARAPTTGRGYATGRDRFRLVELRLSLDFLARIISAHPLDRLDATHGFHHASAAGWWLGIARAPVAIIEEAEILFENCLGSHLADVRIEAAALRLLDTVIEMVRAASPYESVERGFARERERLEAARAAMRRDLTQAWPIEDIARLVGLNTRKLK